MTILIKNSKIFIVNNPLKTSKEPLSFISRMKFFRRGRKVSRKDVRAMIEEGRRF